MEQFINLNNENIENEHLCCIIRKKSKHPGVEAKRQWLMDRLKEGHVFRKLNASSTVFIEYAPLETAWVPIEGDNYFYIYCLWVLGEEKGKGYGKALLEYCIQDAKQKGKSGICLLGSKQQKAWLTDQNFAIKFGFEVVDTTDNGYILYALSFDQTKPRFANNAKIMQINDKRLTIYYDNQCPYIYKNIEKIQKYCHDYNIPASFIHINSLIQAKKLPCVFNNWAVFYKGKFVTVNLIDSSFIKKLKNNDN